MKGVYEGGGEERDKNITLVTEIRLVNFKIGSQPII